jgi:diguanylate cyclase (GGDEF)-like protein
MEYAVSFFDIDFFKKVNDTYGHDAGDIVLKTFAQLLKKSLRKTDIIARYGGEEFIVLSIIKDEAHLPLFLSRLKKIVNENKFIYKEHKLKVTFSSGVVIRSKYDSFEDAIKKSDDLLYEAKRNGRNQIRFDNGDVI